MFIGGLKGNNKDKNLHTFYHIENGLDISKSLSGTISDVYVDGNPTPSLVNEVKSFKYYGDADSKWWL